MQREELQRVWKIAQRHLEEALSEIQLLLEHDNTITSDMSDRSRLMDELATVGGYVQNNEFGLALEHLCYLVKITNIPITKKVYVAIDAAGKIMDMNPELWQSLASNIL